MSDKIWIGKGFLINISWNKPKKNWIKIYLRMSWKDWKEKILMTKLLSGRWIFTMVAAFVFAVLSIKGTLPVDKIHEILILIVYAYFSRVDRVPPNGGK